MCRYTHCSLDLVENGIVNSWSCCALRCRRGSRKWLSVAWIVCPMLRPCSARTSGAGLSHFRQNDNFGMFHMCACMCPENCTCSASACMKSSKTCFTMLDLLYTCHSISKAASTSMPALLQQLHFGWCHASAEKSTQLFSPLQRNLAWGATGPTRR